MPKENTRRIGTRWPASMYCHTVFDRITGSTRSCRSCNPVRYRFVADKIIRRNILCRDPLFLNIDGGSCRPRQAPVRCWPRRCLSREVCWEPPTRRLRASGSFWAPSASAGAEATFLAVFSTSRIADSSPLPTCGSSGAGAPSGRPMRSTGTAPARCTVTSANCSTAGTSTPC